MLNKIIISFLILVNINVYAQNLDSIFESKKEIANSIKLNDDMVKFLYDSGIFFYYRDMSKSEYFFNQSYILSNDKTNTMAGQSLWKLGLIERKKGNLGVSIINLTKAKNIFKEINNQDFLASVYLDIGTLYRYKNEYDKEYEYYKKGFELSKNQQDKTLAKGYLYFGNYYNRNKKLDSAIYCFKKAVDIFSKENDNKKIYNVYNNLANTYYKQKKYKKVISLRNEVLAYAKSNHDKMLVNVNYHNIAAAYAKLKKPHLALKYLDSAIHVGEKEQFKVRLVKSYKSKSLIYKNLNQHKEAYENLKRHKKYSDIVFQSQLSDKIKEIELNNEFELEKKNLQIENQEHAFNNKLNIFIFSTILILLVGFSLFFYNNAKNKARYMKLKLEKETIQKEALSKKVKTSEKEVKNLVADNSMRLEFLKQLSDQIKKDRRNTDSTEVKNYIKDLSLKIKQQITTESKLTDLKEKISSVNDGFENRLISICSELTKTEKEVCLLLRLNLSIKEIAAIRNSSIDAIKATRYRIRKKMNVPKKEKLETYIQSL